MGSGDTDAHPRDRCAGSRPRRRNVDALLERPGGGKVPVNPAPARSAA
jgi:hypothetical protein